jgi:acyl-CoA thioesterase-1
MSQFISSSRRCSALPLIFAAITGLVVACGEPMPAGDQVRSSNPAPSPTPSPEIRVVVLGNSLAAGLGLAAEAAFPAVLERQLRDRGHDVEIVNAGVSGDTTAGGLSRVDWVLQQPTAILVVELGGNDGLRGQSLENTEANLREIVRRGRAAGATVVLAGMDVPTNYGPDYGAAFAQIYPRIAADEDAVLVPGFVRPLGEDPTLLQPDGLHPTAEGQRRLAGRLLPTMLEILDSGG